MKRQKNASANVNWTGAIEILSAKLPNFKKQFSELYAEQITLSKKIEAFRKEMRAGADNLEMQDWQILQSSGWLAANLQALNKRGINVPEIAKK